MKVPAPSQWRQYVTVEPILFLYMFATFVFFPLQQNMVYSSYCDRDAVCSGHETRYTNLSTSSCGRKSQVSARTSHFIFYLTLSTILPGAVTTLLLGRWSDVAGRKLLMALPAAGACASAIVNVLTFELKWSMNILLAGGLVSGLMGSYAMFNQASFAYIADVSAHKHRTRRLGVLEAMIYLGMTLGSEVGGVWTQRHGYGPPYWCVIVSQLLVLCYIAFALKEVPLCPGKKRSRMTLSSMLHGCKLFYKPSPQRRTRLAILVAFVCATINFNALIDVTIPYLRDEPFDWNFELIGHYLALGNLLHGVAAIGVLPLLLRFGISDMVCIQIGIFSSLLSLILLGMAHVTWLVFLVPVVGMLRGMVVPCVRASLSKFVKSDEHGALFSTIAVVEILCTVVASLVYNNAYPATCATLPHSHGFVFILMSGLLTVPLGLFWWVGRQARGSDQVPHNIQENDQEDDSLLAEDDSLLAGQDKA